MRNCEWLEGWSLLPIKDLSSMEGLSQLVILLLWQHHWGQQSIRWKINAQFLSRNVWFMISHQFITTMWKSSFSFICSFHSFIFPYFQVEDFWALYNHIELASRLAAGCDYSLFKEGVKPMWEDDRWDSRQILNLFYKILNLEIRKVEDGWSIWTRNSERRV